MIFETGADDIRQTKLFVWYLNLNSFTSTDDKLLQQLQFNYRRINFERTENGVNERTAFCYDGQWFKAELNKEEWVQRLQLAYGNEALYCSAVFRLFTKFIKGLHPLLRWRTPFSVIVRENVLAVREMVIDDNRSTN